MPNRSAAGDFAPGERNLLTDVAGLRVGNAHDAQAKTGVTVVVPDAPVTAGVAVRGGAPGTRETEALDPSCLVEQVHGIVLTGGSVFGLAAASDEVIKALAARGAGFRYGAGQPPCPVVPGANLFDLTNGGDKNWGNKPPYRGLARAAIETLTADFTTGQAGAGFGATAGVFQGGLGSASVRWRGITVAALVVVNSFGSPFEPASGRPWAENLAFAGDFPGDGPCTVPPAVDTNSPFAFSKAGEIENALQPGMNTTLAIVATDAVLSKAETTRMALMADDGLSRAIRPMHTPFDGDVVFALSTGLKDATGDRPLVLSMIGALAADCLSRAVMRGVCAALTTRRQ